MGKKKTKKLLKQIQNELKMIRVRQDWAEQSISNLQKSSLRDCEASSKLDERVFKLEQSTVCTSGVVKLLEYDVKVLGEHVDKLAKASKEK